MKEAFHTTEKMYRLVVESAPNAVVMADREGKIVLVNKQAEKLFGYKRKEMLGKPVELLLPSRFRTKHVQYRKGYTAAPETRKMGAGRDLFGMRKDGSEVPVEIGLNPIRSGSETYVLAAIVDITERRELQRKLAQNEALAAVGSMAAVMAHEIRNPLGSIVMAARSLTRGELGAEDRATVSSVLSMETERLNRTLQDFLQYARPREPKRELSDLNHLVKEIVQALTSDKDLVRKVRIAVSLDERLPRFSYDADQVRQVLWNLMLNGVQAIDGQGWLKISTSAEDGLASFSMIDSGPGIDPKTIERIFEPFFTTKKKGTGLGLAIAQRIIQAHGGRIVVENEPKAGAKFRVIFPLRAAAGS
jgi:two-component system, LuxR family, sensor kinase FixL